MSLFLPPVTFTSRSTGLPMTVHPTAAHTTLCDGLSHFTTEYGYDLVADAASVATHP